MDNAEQSPRPPSKGIFDTASLLAPSSTIFSSQSPTPVQSPLPHLAHSPSAFSVLGRNAVLIPPPSSNSDSTSPSGSSKICSPIMHHSASDALSSLASSSVLNCDTGPCSWWSAASPIGNSSEFPGCGVPPITDPFVRPGLCRNSPVAPAHLSVQQPRRIVEEVLGHLYAKPPSAESKNDSQTSGIPSPQTLCKTSILPNIVGVSPKKLTKTKSSDKESNHAKSEKCKSSNNLSSPVSGISTVSGNQSTKSSSKKSSEPVTEQIARLLSTTEKPKRKNKPKACKPDSAKNGKSTKTEKKQTKQPKEKKGKKSSSESDGHVESSSSTTSPESAGAVSSSSSDSSDDEEREKQQKQLARLKRQQQELRRKVQELKQASHESVHQKSEAHTKKSPTNSKNSLPSSGGLNHTLKPVPSPAHSSPLMPVPSKTMSPEAKSSICDLTVDEEQNLSFPLDLCMKKQEPTFEVTTSMTSSYIPTPTTAMAKKKTFQMAGSNVSGANNNSSNKLSAVPKKRGRKPKAVPMPGNPPAAHSEKVRQIKRNSIKDISSLLMPPKMDLLPGHATNTSLLKSSNPGSCPKVHAPNTLGAPNDILPHSRKNFTLDCLLSETNGNLHFPENEPTMFPTSSVGVNKIFKHKERQRNNSNKVKKFEEKIKEPESPLRPETSSPSDSDPDDDNSDSDDTEHSHPESITDSTSTSGHKRKHSFDEDSEDYRNKKKRVVPDEREVQIPLEHGWRRETRIRCFSRSGVRGEVAYYTPCGKKLRSYPEVVRYLVKNGITDISRDNFTFSTKVNVGEFLECISSGAGQDYVLLSENEVLARIEEARARKGRLGVQNRKSSAQHRAMEEEEQQRQWEQKQMQHHLEQQARSREAQESKLLRQAQREQALMAAREEKRLRAEESRKQKEQQRIMKQQEKFERMEQLRIEREIRAQQMLEDQEMKRQQAVFLREQERERRRQHMILVRALENRKKQEERERKREEILFEKRINREKKLEQRRIELDYLRELKKPVDDMMLKDLMPLPTLNRIPGVKLCGKAFADTLMVFEFLHNFGETLGFDVDSLPTLNTLQTALLNLDEKCEDELLSIVHHLLVCAIDDPGIQHCPEAATVLGQNLKDADITNSNVSEVLRLYFIAQDKRSPMLEWLQTKPFLSLNATQKAEVIAFLCDELLTSRLLTRQIDSNIENVNVLRKDKWLVEGDLRRYRSIQQRRALKARLSAMEENRDNPNCANMLSADIPDFSLTESKENTAGNEDSEAKEAAKSDKEKLEEMENELANESGNESDDTQAPGQISDGEDEDLHLSNDEINKKIEKLTKQLTLCSNKLTKAFYTIRGATFGMDRYHRRYWVLPKAGGVYVESMESSLRPEEQAKVLAEAKEPPVKKEEDTDSVKDESIVKEKCAEEKQDSSSEKTDMVDDKDVDSKMDTSVDEKAVNELDESKDVKPVIEEKEELCKVKVKLEENDDLEPDKECEMPEVDKCSIKKEEDIEMEEIIQIAPEPENAAPEKSATIDLKEEMDDDSIIIINSESKDNVVDNNNLKSAQDEEIKINPSKETEGKSTPEILPSPIKRTWTPDKKPSNDSDNTLNLKKEKEIKVKKEEKKESRHKENENKFIDKMIDMKEEKKPVNIFMPNLCDNSINLDLGAPKLHGTSERQHAPNPSIPPDQNWLFNSPLFASILAGNMLFNGPLMPQRDMNGTYFNLPKNDSNNPFGPFLGLQPGMLSAEQIFKSLGEKPSNQKPWFSILPRMPCDESLLNSPQGSRNSAIHSPANICSPDVRSNSRVAHSSPTANPAPPPGHVASALSNLQMELMNGVVPPGFFLHPFLPPQFGPTYQSTPPSTCASHHSSFTSTVSHSSPMPDFNLNFNRPPPASTPNSIPTPSATPGPTSHGCATPTSRDTPSPCFTKRLLMEKMTQEYEAPQPIPPELQRGWWRITDPNQLKLVISALHHRGIREKMFQKQLQKHFTFACASCTQGQGRDTDLEITDMDKEISKCAGGAPDPDPEDFWYKDIALRVDMGILEQVENLEEKVDGSSMQVKCWKPPPKLSTEQPSKFVPSCEQYVHRTADEIYDAIKEKQLRKNAKKSSSRKKKPVKKEQEPEPSEVDPEKKPEEEGSEMIVDTEAAEPSEPVTEDLDKSTVEDSSKIESDIIALPNGKLNPVEEAKKRLLKVEASIERRYLRPPLGTRSTISSGGAPSNPVPTDTSEEENIPVGLVKWRNAVENCRTAAQLSMCLNFLETCTAWDKSIMRASCQFCHSGDNEEKLLLCDGCDKGYHTYCFKPVMETIPEGDWYCFECLNKATGDNVCVICGTKGKLIECETCPKTFHLNCLEPPLAKMPKGKWYCSGCNLTRPKKSKKSNANKEKETPKEKETKETAEKTPKKAESTSTSKSKSSEKKKKEEKKKEPEPVGNVDLAPCSTILEEMQKHEDAWPFLTPVNTKQFPTYRKVIKKPMDMQTMKNKLEAGQYKCREDFANDARLIFDNCETFNEDESPVGQAGHSMRAFFESRWSELCST
ncbi:bromodomain adjacent to zinc finger domain protein 2B-like isoform X4 [Argiope bruennichi]|uniref:bromodomain adjacent to zinc finger domain protein 2B-like isoform X4 n=1 Tax=Argiope bruennichi TaxID=94029 RepID=UPI00249417C0|nr:bromodomain adjacent to zinc finger domain protein 2B-like isoform X4 [Argiope bruennichi]